MDNYFSNEIFGNILLATFIIVIYAASHYLIKNNIVKNTTFFIGIFFTVFSLIYLLLKLSFKKELKQIIKFIKFILTWLKDLFINNAFTKILIDIIRGIFNNKIYIFILLLLSGILFFSEKGFLNFNNINSNEKYFGNIINFLRKNTISSYLVNAILLLIITSIIVCISYITASKFFTEQNNNVFINMLKFSVLWQFFSKNNKLSIGSYYAMNFSFILSMIFFTICLVYYVSLFNDKKDTLSVGDKVTINDKDDNNVYIVVNLNDQKTKAVLASKDDEHSRKMTYDVHKLTRVKPSMLYNIFKYILLSIPILIILVLFGILITKLDFSNVRSYKIFKTLISSILTLLPCILYSIISSYKIDFNNFSFSKTIGVVYIIELIIIFLFYTIFIDKSFLFKKNYIDVLEENKKSQVLYLDKKDNNNIYIDKILTDNNGDILTVDEIKESIDNKSIILNKSCNYALSFWFNLNPQNTNNGLNNIITLSGKDNNINISYDSDENTIIIKTEDDNLIVPYVPFQKWNYMVINSDGSNLDIYFNGEYINSCKWICRDNKTELINNVLMPRKKPFNLLKTLEIGSKYTYGAITKIYYYNNILKNYQIINNYNTTILPK